MTPAETFDVAEKLLTKKQAQFSFRPLDRLYLESDLRLVRRFKGDPRYHTEYAARLIFGRLCRWIDQYDFRRL